MKSLSTLKKNLEFNRELHSIIEALKNIAVSQYHILERKIKSFGRLLTEIEDFFKFIGPLNANHPFLTPSSKQQAVIAITSDSGLLGGLNMQVVGHALSELERIPGKLIVIGQRGKIYARESGVPFVAFPGIKDEERYGQAIQVRNYILERVLNRQYGHLKVVYPKPISFTVQRIEIVNFFPFIWQQESESAIVEDAIFESNIADIAEYLIFTWAGQKLFEIFGLSRLSEMAARYVHLEESSQKIKDMDAKTKLEYFRVRHELIDRNMRELFAARLIYAG